MFLKFAGVIILGGIAELDRTSVFHGLLSEPIVLCPLVGFFLGDPMLGLKVGVILQLFFLGSISMGGSSPPDAAMAAVAVTATASLSADWASVPPSVALPAAILIAMVPAGKVGSIVDERLKESNVELLHKTEDAVELNGAQAIEGALRKSLITAFVVFSMAIAIITSVTAVTASLVLNFLPESWWKALEVSGNLILLSSVGIALASLRERRAMWVYAGAGICLLGVIWGTV